RLPGGRGDPDDARAPARERGDPRRDALAPDGHLLDQPHALGVLHGQGPARDLHRPLPRAPRGRAGRPRAGRGAPVALMAVRIQIVAILVTGGLFALVFELVRRRRLMERYALLWLFASAVLLLLA